MAHTKLAVPVKLSKADHLDLLRFASVRDGAQAAALAATGALAQAEGEWQGVHKAVLQKHGLDPDLNWELNLNTGEIYAVVPELNPMPAL